MSTLPLSQEHSESVLTARTLQNTAAVTAHHLSKWLIKGATEGRHAIVYVGETETGRSEVGVWGVGC